VAPQDCADCLPDDQGVQCEGGETSCPETGPGPAWQWVWGLGWRWPSGPRSMRVAGQNPNVASAEPRSPARPAPAARPRLARRSDSARPLTRRRGPTGSLPARMPRSVGSGRPLRPGPGPTGGRNCCRTDSGPRPATRRRRCAGRPIPLTSRSAASRRHTCGMICIGPAARSHSTSPSSRPSSLSGISARPGLPSSRGPRIGLLVTPR
jgi:hypothetical protein